MPSKNSSRSPATRRARWRACPDYLFDRTGGSIGSLRLLVSKAAQLAMVDGSERIDRGKLDQVSIDMNAEGNLVASVLSPPARSAPRLKRAQ